MTACFSLKEAAVIADVPEPTIRKAIEAKTIHPTAERAGGAPRYRFSAHDLLFLKLLSAFPLPLRQEDKRAFWDILERKLPASGRWQRSDNELIVESNGIEVRVDLGYTVRKLVGRLRVFRRGRHRIVESADILGGEPVFAGTRIPLSHISALLAKNVPVQEVKEDYPALSAEDLEYAAMVARMKSGPGRPRKLLTLVRDDHPITVTGRVDGGLEATS